METAHSHTGALLFVSTCHELCSPRKAKNLREAAAGNASRAKKSRAKQKSCEKKKADSNLVSFHFLAERKKKTVGARMLVHVASRGQSILNVLPGITSTNPRQEEYTSPSPSRSRSFVSITRFGIPGFVEIEVKLNYAASESTVITGGGQQAAVMWV